MISATNIPYTKIAKSYPYNMFNQKSKQRHKQSEKEVNSSSSIPFKFNQKQRSKNSHSKQMIDVYHIRMKKQNKTFNFAKKNSKAALKNSNSLKPKKRDSSHNLKKNKKIKTRLNTSKKRSKKNLRRLNKVNSSIKDCTTKTSDKLTSSMLKETLLHRSISPEKSDDKSLRKTQKLLNFIENSMENIDDISNDKINFYKSVGRKNKNNNSGHLYTGKSKKKIVGNNSKFHYFSKKKSNKEKYRSAKELSNFILKGKMGRALCKFKSAEKIEKFVKKNLERFSYMGQAGKKNANNSSIGYTKNDYEKFSKKDLINMILEKDREIAFLLNENLGKKKFTKKIDFLKNFRSKSKKKIIGKKKRLSRDHNEVQLKRVNSDYERPSSSSEAQKKFFSRRKKSEIWGNVNPILVSGLEGIKQKVEKLVKFNMRVLETS